MGCCLTTAAAAPTPPKTSHHQLDDSKTKPDPRDVSPPLAFEEETVKEVLSETPIVPKNPPTVAVDRPEIVQSSLNGAVVEENQENVSEMSEMYSYSESFSAATTVTATDAKRDEIEMEDDGEVTQKVKKSPPVKRVPRKRPTVSSGELAGKNDRGIRPPARRPVAPSPEKKGQMPSRTVTTAQRHRNVGPLDVSRREHALRRSRSPAMRRETGKPRNVRERSSPGKSGDRVAVNAGESEGKCKLEKAGEGVVLPEPETEPVPVPVPEPEPEISESLENPLVSLECFIFL